MEIAKIKSSQPLLLAQMTTWQSGILQSSAHRQAKKLTDSFLKKYDLSNMHWLIVGTIFETGDNGILLTELSEKVGTTAGYVTTAINSLEAKGMVFRCCDGDDNRTKTLTIPPEMRPRCAEIEVGLRELLRSELYSKMERQDLETYVLVLQKLANLT